MLLKYYALCFSLFCIVIATVSATILLTIFLNIKKLQ